VALLESFMQSLQDHHVYHARNVNKARPKVRLAVATGEPE
jgi:hypothetical protein